MVHGEADCSILLVYGTKGFQFLRCTISHSGKYELNFKANVSCVEKVVTMKGNGMPRIHLAKTMRNQAKLKVMQIAREQYMQIRRLHEQQGIKPSSKPQGIDV